MSAKLHKNRSKFQRWDQICQISNFGSRSSIPNIKFIISMFDFFWVPNFIKIEHIAIVRSNLPKFLILVQDLQFQISYLWLANLTYSECHISKHWNIFLSGPNFPGMRGLVLVSMSNGRYFTVTLFNLVVTWLLLLVNARCLVVAGDYSSLLVLTARSRFLCERILGDLSTHYCSRIVIFQ